jgi:hypothetical protein
VPDSRFGVPDSSLGFSDSSLGFSDFRFGVPDSRFGVPDSSFGLSDSSFGLSDSSFDMSDSSLGLSDSIFDVSESSLGVFCLNSIYIAIWIYIHRAKKIIDVVIVVGTTMVLLRKIRITRVISSFNYIYICLVFISWSGSPMYT